MDTGFSGHLTLPPDEAERLGLKRENQIPVTLAGDQQTEASVHTGYVKWLGQTRRIDVLAMDGQPLLGMSLLAGSKIAIRAQAGGEILIEEDLDA